MKHTLTLLTALLLAPLAALLAAEAPPDLALFDGNYPRAFFFRAAEGGPVPPQPSGLALFSRCLLS